MCTFKDLTGIVFERLTVKSFAGRNDIGQSLWWCECSCGGNGKALLGHHLLGGKFPTKSCGCLSKENIKKASLKHGMSISPEGNSYYGAKKRCNPEHKDNLRFKDHAGRGIEFRFTSFEEFIEEVGPKPEPKRAYSLDRINNDGHYEKGNVRWTTHYEQTHNRRCASCNRLRERIKELERRLSDKGL